MSTVSRGDRSTSLWDEGRGSVSDHQSGGDGLRQREESQSRGGSADGRAESAADGEARLHHGLPHGAAKQANTKTLTADRPHARRHQTLANSINTSHRSFLYYVYIPGIK